jgi:hypothetical protein
MAEPHVASALRAKRAEISAYVPHLTGGPGGPGGWRFQMRVPTKLLAEDSRIVVGALVVRASLGPRGRGEARRLARQLATLCQAVFALAATKKETAMATPQSPGNNDTELARQVIDACQNAIKRAVAQPSQAIGLARGLDAALTSLRLVQSETSKGEAGARAVVDNAAALTRHALKDVLKLASDPARALDVLSTTSDIVPSVMSTTPSPVRASQQRAPGARPLPTFGEVSQAYIDMRIGRDEADHPDISILQLRRQTFIDVLGDRPIDQYWPSDLQTYVNKMKFFPANVTKRSDAAGKSTLEILEANKNLALMPMAEKTMRGGYVANIRTMARHLMIDRQYRDPFSGVQITYPPILRASTPREGIGIDVLNRVFRDGVDSGLLDEAMLPPLAKLCSRRIGLLTYLRGSDIREKYGVMVAQVSGIVFDANKWQRVPIKTGASAGFFVLHNFLREIGFTDWALQQGDNWIFAAAHEHPDPAKYMSKTMRRLLRRNGAQAGEVFHSLRGDGIDEMREAEVDGRTRRLQSGHQLGDEHEKYGHRALKFTECRRLATLPLPEGIGWSTFKGLDFDRLAAARRSPGRRAKKGG